MRIESPIDGIVTRRNIQEGETAVIGTMNNAGTVLLTLADMGVIQAEVEVDETNIPHVTVGQLAKVTIDALPDQTFNGHVTEIGNSPDSGDRRGGRIPTGHELQGRRRDRRRHPERAARIHLHGRHHDGHEKGRSGRPDSGGRRPGAAVRRQRPGREGAAGRPQAPPVRGRDRSPRPRS